LKMITLPANIKEIGQSAFIFSGVEEVIFEGGSHLEAIGDDAFKECRKLRSISIPSNVTIGDAAFEGTGCDDESIFTPGAWIVDCEVVRCTPCAVDEQFYDKKSLVNGTTCSDAFVEEGFLELKGIDCVSTQAIVRFSGCCGPKASPTGSCPFCAEDKGEFMPDQVSSSGRCGDIYSQTVFDKFNGFRCTQNQGAVNRAGCCSNPVDDTPTVITVRDETAVVTDSGNVKELEGLRALVEGKMSLKQKHLRLKQKHSPQ